MSSYTVVKPYVTVRVTGDDGVKVLREFYEGGQIPKGADESDLERLLRKGMIAKEGSAGADAAVPHGVPVTFDDAGHAVPTSPAQRAADAAPAGKQPGNADADAAPPASKPGNNDSRDKWVAYATGKGAPAEETKPTTDGGLSRDALRDKYGS